VKAFEKGFWRGHHPFLQDDLSPFVQDADAALFVAQIDSTYRRVSPAGFLIPDLYTAGGILPELN